MQLLVKTGWQSWDRVCYLLAYGSKEDLKDFVSDPESDYYQGEVFSRVLNYVKSNPKKVTMRQRNDKLTLTFENTKTITQAFEKVSEISPDLSQPFRHVPVPTTAQ